MRGLGNIIFGVIFIIGGGSGQLALVGTNSSGALVALGLGLLGYGGYQAWQGMQEAPPPAE